MSAPQLTAVILTLNEALHIQACIQSLAWADRVVVFDSFSQDETVALAKAAGADVYQSRFENYAQQRNAALEKVQTEWLLFVDADERATAVLAEEIRHVISQRPEVGWQLPRHNYIFGRLTKGAGWFPDYQARLFKRGLVRYERAVHELALVDGAQGQLQNPLIHYNYADIGQFHRTQQRYSSYDAQMLYAQPFRPKPHHFISQPLRHFYWRFVTLKGYRDGRHGLHLSALMAYYEWVKYKKVAALWRKEAKENG